MIRVDPRRPLPEGWTVEKNRHGQWMPISPDGKSSPWTWSARWDAVGEAWRLSGRTEPLD